MNRGDLRRLAEMRIKEARVLFDNGCYEGAYYLAGYSIECALKACVASKTQQHDFPDKKLANQVYTHNLNELIGASGLQQARDEEMRVSSDFAQKWSTVKDWSEEMRYNTTISKLMAEDLLIAITDTKHGVLEWLKKLW